VATVGGLFVDLKLEGLDATQMDDLGGVTDEILEAQMEILAENEVYDSGKYTMGEDPEDEESFSGRGTHNHATPEFKAGDSIVYLGQEGDENLLGYVVAGHGDGKGGPPFYTAYLEGLGGKQVEGQQLFPVADQDDQPPPLCPPQSHPTLLPGPLKPERTKGRRKNILSRCLKWPRSSSSSIWKIRNLKKSSQILKDRLSRCLKLSVSNKRTLLLTRGTNLLHPRSLGIIMQSPKEEDLTVLGIYADVIKFLLEVNGVVGSLFKVCESYSKAHLYLKEHFVKDHPAPSNVATTDSPPSLPEGGSSSPPPPPPGGNRSDLVKASMLDRRAQCYRRSVKGKRR
jgi:hypothetical protein